METDVGSRRRRRVQPDPAAVERLQEWLDEHDHVVDALRSRAAAQGVVLDLTPDSLPALVTWVAEQMERRPDGEDWADAPAWSGDEGLGMAQFWRTQTLELVNQAAHYYGEVLVRASSGAQWRVGNDPNPHYVHEGKPVLEVNGHDVEPRRVVFTFCTGVKGGSKPPDAIMTAFRIVIGATTP
jgi:hypothetical protein